MAYLGGLGAGLVALVMPGYLNAMTAQSWSWQQTVHAWMTLLGLFFAALLATSAYSFPAYFDFMAAGPLRAEWSYEAAAMWGDTLPGTLSSWVAPLSADIHGAFGGSAIPLFALLAPLAWLVGVRPPGVVW